MAVVVGRIAHADFVGPFGYRRHFVLEIEGTEPHHFVALVVVPGLVGAEVIESRLLGVINKVGAVTFGDVVLVGLEDACLAARAPADFVVGEFRNQRGEVEAHDFVEDIAAHNVLVVNQYVVKEMDGTVEGFLHESWIMDAILRNHGGVINLDVDGDVPLTTGASVGIAGIGEVT